MLNRRNSGRAFVSSDIRKASRDLSKILASVRTPLNVPTDVSAQPTPANGKRLRSLNMGTARAGVVIDVDRRFMKPTAMKPGPIAY